MARKKETERIRMTSIRREQILSRCEGICLHCGKELKLGENFSIEHVIPLNKGGDNSFENTVALCKECNFEKGDDIVAADFYSYAPKLVGERISEILNGYYEENDWLTEKNIFKHDRFAVGIEKSIMIPGTGRVVKKKSEVQVRKISEEEYFTFLDNIPEEKAVVCEVDGETKTSSSPVEGSMYKVMSNGKAVLTLFTGLLAGKGNDSAILRIIVSVNPDIAWGVSARNSTCTILNAIFDEFSKSINSRNTKGYVLVCLDALAGDKRASGLIKSICEADERGAEMLIDPETNQIAFYRMKFAMGFGVKDEEGEITMEEFAKKEKLYSGQLRRRLKQNG